MTTNVTSKNNPIKLVEYLGEKFIAKNKILEELNIKSSTFYRYLNLIKKAGFKVVKRKGEYSILLFSNELELQEFEKSLFAYLICNAHLGLASKKIKTFEVIVDKILTLCDKKSYEEIIKKFKTFKKIIFKKEYAQKIEAVEKYIKEKTKVKILAGRNKEYTLTPINLNWNKKGLIINFIDEKDRLLQIPIEKISKITPTNKKEYFFSKKETIFELYGKLAKSYLLKDEERIVDSHKNRLVVANDSLDKQELYKRLLRYDSFCKIISPNEDVENFSKLINLSIENLDKLKDNISDFTKV